MDKDIKVINYKDLAVYSLFMIIFAVSLWYRLFPARFDSLQAIDPFYLARMTLTVVNNNLHVPDYDPLRYYPDGFNPRLEGFMLYYIYGIIYVIVSKFANVDFWIYAKIIPAVFGALITIPVYFIGKEIKDRKTGLIAALLYATSSAVMFRSSAGFFEKEPLGGLFIFTTVWFVFRSLRNNSLIDAIIAGVSLMYASIIWGGTSSLYLVLTGAFGLMILSARYPRSLLNVYSSLAFFTIIMAAIYVRYKITDTMILGFIGLYIIFIIIEIYRIYNRVSKEDMRYRIPVFFGGLGVLLIISSLFSKTSADIVKKIISYIVLSKDLVGTTVAENIGAGWGDVVSRLGTPYFDAFLKSYGYDKFTFLSYISSPWVWSFIGVVLITYLTFKDKENKDYWYYSALIANVVSIFSIHGYLTNTNDPAKQSFIYTIYVLSFVVANFIIMREDYKYGLLMSFFYATMMAFFTKVRIVFLTGPFVIALASFSFSYFIDSIKGVYVRYKDNNNLRYFVFVAALFIVGVFVVGNLVSGYILASKAIGPSYNSNWKKAMDFLRYNTSEDSVILSWWDFGYWFQTEGHRATLLDGGNVYGGRNIEAARYFTGYYNKTERLEYLKKWHPTHLLVDASMIGKYAAMSKIANLAKKIDSYLGMSLVDKIRKNGISVYKYSAYNVYNLYIPINESDGSLGGEITFVDSRVGTPIPVKYICTPQGYKQISYKENVIDGCVVFGGRTAYLASHDIMVSPFNKIYIMDGYDMDYLNKVFDNGEIKIFEINYTKIDEDLKMPKNESVKVE